MVCWAHIELHRGVRLAFGNGAIGIAWVCIFIETVTLLVFFGILVRFLAHRLQTIGFSTIQVFLLTEKRHHNFLVLIAVMTLKLVASNVEGSLVLVCINWSSTFISVKGGCCHILGGHCR